MRRSTTVRAVLAAVGLAVLLALTGCGGATTPAPSWPAGAIVVTAEGLAFDRTELVIPADEPFTLVLVNRDGDLHNIAIRTRPSFEGELLFRHDAISASTAVLAVGPIPAGSYFFLCELHPQMHGTVLAQ
ncbi:MAG TPA: cupredoxin domain-containing protein [Candidatus Limnocylindrales bacterium]|nr:cupredoxin domain-containing protein [Candidatus Limnocylindrales bacterium]